MKKVSGFFPAILVVWLFVGGSGSAGGATMYYSDSTGADTGIYSLDSSTGSDALIMTVPGAQLFGLSPGATANTMYGIDVTTGTGCLYTIDIAARGSSLIGCVGIDVREIAFDRNRQVLYGTDYANLYTMDTSAGAPSFVGPFGGPTMMWAMDYDQGTGILYGVDAGTNQLYSISTTTGTASAIGPTGQSRITDIFAEPSTGTIFGVGNGPANFYSINKNTGAAVVASPLTGTGAVGLSGVQPAVVPTMTGWSLLGFAVLAGILSLFVVRRSQSLHRA